jgi:ribose transport system substrate-binding protein
MAKFNDSNAELGARSEQPRATTSRRMVLRSAGVAGAASFFFLTSNKGASALLLQEGTPVTSDEIAALEEELSQNVYVQAVENAGQEMSENTGKVFGPDEPIRIAFSIEGLSHPYLVNQSETAQEVGESLGAEVSVVSAEDDAAKQVSDLEAILAGGTDALVMMPASTQGIANVLAQYEEQGIPYFFATKGAEDVNPTGVVLANYAGEGRALGEFVVDHYAEQGLENVKVAIISGIAGDLSSVARTGEFKLALLKSGNFEIVAEQPGEYRREPSAEVMEGILAAHPDVQLVFGANDEAALGALSAIRAAGRDDIDIVGIDGQSEIFPEIESGAVLATHTHLPTAGLVVEAIVNYLRGEPIPAVQVPEDEQLVTKERIEAGEVEPAF